MKIGIWFEIQVNAHSTTIYLGGVELWSYEADMPIRKIIKDLYTLVNDLDSFEEEINAPGYYGWFNWHNLTDSHPIVLSNSINMLEAEEMDEQKEIEYE